MDISERLAALRKQMATLQAEQTQASQVVQNHGNAIQQHMGAIAILEELLVEQPAEKEAKDD
jgi:hypothetical protein